jgi:hypothetical protein
MLEGLGEIDWVVLEHAYGSASDMPELIRALRAPAASVRKKALHSLYGNIFHQGTRYEASAYAVPFLVELLTDPTTPDRASIVELLASLAVGYDEQWLPGAFPIGKLRVRAEGGEAVLRAAPGFTGTDDRDEYGERALDEHRNRYAYVESLGEGSEERMWAHVELAVYDAVRAGLPVLRGLLTDGDARVRVMAAYSLGWFSENGVENAPALRVATADPEPDVAATALVALGLLSDHEAVRLAQDALASPHRVVRWAAAVASAQLRGRDAEPSAAAELLAWAGGEIGVDREIPYLNGDLGGLAGLALDLLALDYDDTSFDALLARIPAVSGIAALTVVGAALRRVLPDGLPKDTSFAALGRNQQRLLRVLAHSPATWRISGNTFGNFSLLMAGFGLPMDPEKLLTYVTS